MLLTLNECWKSFTFRLAKTWMWLDTCFLDRDLPVRNLMYLAINSLRPGMKPSDNLVSSPIMLFWLFILFWLFPTDPSRACNVSRVWNQPKGQQLGASCFYFIKTKINCLIKQENDFASDVHHQAACPTIPKQFCLIHTKWQHFILTGEGTGSKVKTS